MTVSKALAKPAPARKAGTKPVKAAKPKAAAQSPQVASPAAGRMPSLAMSKILETNREMGAKPKAAKPKASMQTAQVAGSAASSVPLFSKPMIGFRGEIVTNSESRIFDTTQLYRFDPEARIAVIRRGVPAAVVGELATTMGTSKEFLLGSLGMSRATIGRKEKENTTLSSDESERILGVATLIGKVQTMVEESGNPEGFNAAHWVAEWLAKPLPALGGATPGSYMDTFEGQKLVAELLAMSQSGAYA